MTIDQRMTQLGITLPAVSSPAASYTNCVQAGNLLFVSGKGPLGKPSGKLGAEFDTEQGQGFAREAGLQILAAVAEHLGDLDKVQRVVKLQGFINATDQFSEHHLVLNGCSELMQAVFEDAGVHARSVFGAVSLRDNLPVIVDSIFEVRQP